MDVTTKTIGGREITITRCSATDQLDLELSIAKVAGDIDLVPFMAGDLKAAAAAGLVDGLRNIAKNLTKAELIRLMTMVFKGIAIDGKKITDINVDFADRPRDIWEVFIAAIVHNLGPLVEGLASSAPTSQTTPTT